MTKTALVERQNKLGIASFFVLFMHSYPTQYKGINFRSRLEAKWAAFFDLLDWSYEYEPCDFKGWIPDFLLKGRLKGYESIFIEVKPIDFNEMPENVMRKIDISGCLDTCIILGKSINYPDFGLIRNIIPREQSELEYNGSDAEYTLSYRIKWTRARFVKLSKAEKFGFCHWGAPDTDPLTGEVFGGPFPSWENRQYQEEIAMLWKEAGNKVQWKSPFN